MKIIDIKEERERKKKKKEHWPGLTFLRIDGAVGGAH